MIKTVQRCAESDSVSTTLHAECDSVMVTKLRCPECNMRQCISNTASQESDCREIDCAVLLEDMR